jgi:hypothetical protein
MDFALKQKAASKFGFAAFFDLAAKLAISMTQTLAFLAPPLV